MSSKFSVKNFCSDQDTLQNAADALSDYLKISIIWTIGVILWIYFSYMSSFKSAVNKTKTLKMPYINMFKSTNNC